MWFYNKLVKALAESLLNHPHSNLTGVKLATSEPWGSALTFEPQISCLDMWRNIDFTIHLWFCNKPVKALAKSLLFHPHFFISQWSGWDWTSNLRTVRQSSYPWATDLLSEQMNELIQYFTIHLWFYYKTAKALAECLCRVIAITTCWGGIWTLVLISALLTVNVCLAPCTTMALTLNPGV